MTNQIDTEQFNKILKYINEGKNSGAKLETGGNKLGSKGYYIQPTVFSNVKVFCLSSNHFAHEIELLIRNLTNKVMTLG